MASYLRPRRGKKSTAESQNIILKRGEVFFESPDTGVGTGAGKIKVGDGTTAYNNLPYFLEPTLVDVANATIAFTEASSTTPATLLSAISSGAKLNTITGTIKKLLSLYNTSITNLQTSFQNGCSTIANAITANGVSTATNASPDTMATNISTLATNKYNAGVTATKVGTAVAANVLSGKTFTNSSGVGLSGSMVDRGAWTNTPTTSGNITIPAGYHNGSGYVNTATVYNNGYTAGAAAGKKYVKVENVPVTKVTTYDMTYCSGVGDKYQISAEDQVLLIKWSDLTGGWVPSMVKITNKSTKVGHEYSTVINKIDKVVYNSCIKYSGSYLGAYSASGSYVTYIYPDGAAAGVGNALVLFVSNGVLFPFPHGLSLYDIYIAEAWE